MLTAPIPFAWAMVLLAQAQTEPATDIASRDEMRFLKEKVTELKLYQPANLEKPLVLTDKPVLGPYNNWTGPSRFGATFLWLTGERPVAAVSISIRRSPTNAAVCECTSFWPTLLECQREGNVIWTPQRGGLLGQRFSESPPPAGNKTQRLTQMRDLARRFSATFYRSEPEEATHLRVLPTPIHRFAAEKEGIVDGGLFAIANATDPDALLLIEAVHDKPDALPYWRYSLGRMSSARTVVRLDDREIWSLPNFHRDPLEAKLTGPYIEKRVGTYRPADAESK